MMERIELLDVVKLRITLPAQDWQTGEDFTLQIGETGTVVEMLAPDTFLVEFADDDGVPYAIPVLHSYQVQLVCSPNLAGVA
jgi:hypothetical protein